jgi:phage terminase large subunit
VSVDIATAVIRAKVKWGSELEFIDATGGWAAGAADVLRDSGYIIHNVQFASPALDRRYANRRAECWFQMADAIKTGTALPNIPEMVPELTAPTYLFRKGQFVLEEKDQIKARIGVSPDLADALATTYALPEMPAKALERLRQSSKVKRDADPFDVTRENEGEDPWR